MATEGGSGLALGSTTRRRRQTLVVSVRQSRRGVSQRVLDGMRAKDGMTAQARMTMTVTAGGDPPCPARPVPRGVARDERRLATAWS